MNQRKIKIDLKLIFSEGKDNSRGTEFITTCPWCGKEKHFYVNKENLKFNCKKCSVRGNIFSLLKKVNKMYLLDGMSINTNIDKIKSINELNEQEEILTISEERDVLLPVGSKLALNNNYLLEERKLTNLDIIKYDIRVTNLSYNFKNYVIFPIYQGEKIKAFVSRYASKNIPERKLRYNNSKNKLSKFLYGLDELHSSDFVFIVEGIFDKISLDKKFVLLGMKNYKTVCSFGKKISSEQINLLRIKGIKKVGLLFDRDAIKESKENSNKLEKYFDVYVYFSIKKDIDLCSLEETEKIINNPYSVYGFFVNQIDSIFK